MELILLLAFAFLANGHPLPDATEERFLISNPPQNFVDFSKSRVFGASAQQKDSQRQRNFVVSQQPQSEEDPSRPVVPAGFEFQNEGDTIPIFQREAEPVIEEEAAQVNIISSQPRPEVTISQPQEPRVVSQEQIRFPQLDSRRAYIISETRSEPTADGRSSFTYQTSNGIKVQKETFLDDDGFNVIRGSYSYVDTNGKEVTVAYIADRNGYRTNTSS